MLSNSNVYQIGDVTVTRIGELTLGQYTPASLFPDWDAKVLINRQDWLSPDSMSQNLEYAFMSVHIWLVKTPRHTILIDPGVGNDKNRPYTPAFDRLRLPFLERLAEAGAKPEAVDFVLMTHLHVDHVGWNTRLDDGRWVPTFKNARYVFSKKEYEYYQASVNHTDRNKTSVIIQQDSVIPIIEAGLAEMINIDGSEFIDGLSFKPTPGHSIDHSSIALSSHGENALFAGDVLHHPIQVRYPEWNSSFDAFTEQARASRLWALEYAVERQAVLFSSHFPESAAGTVVREGDKFTWR
ncbi:metallo-beta-lactamase [Lucifera butyrica]|uniref:Metallo-beta-lactamase n=1 Tax=Lucifera butyrica TaxID=1351585 RepID=A0A498RCU8_9FIRM|nr:MBL fold metallo-hydrolase [Lucifera butyrica]VBB08875.1 metallo-beta-lactamase [Lucifera butyrica]